jgi:transcriptional regulator with XRE-family HTH domain
MDAENMAQRLKAARGAAGLSQMALATRAGTSLQVVTQIEQGNILDPHIST